LLQEKIHNSQPIRFKFVHDMKHAHCSSALSWRAGARSQAASQALVPGTGDEPVAVRSAQLLRIEIAGVPLAVARSKKYV